MKSFLISVLFLVLVINAKAQLSIDKNIRIDGTQESVRKFISHHQFDYALFSWNTNYGSSSTDEFKSIIKQNNNWYLLKIKYKNYSIAGLPTVIVDERKLTEIELKTISIDLKTDSTFLFSQDEVSSLPDKCIYTKDGKERGLLSVIDGVRLYLVKYEDKTFTSLSYYAPQSYLQNCYPYVPEFGKLKGLVNTSEGFWKVFKEFNLE